MKIRRRVALRTAAGSSSRGLQVGQLVEVKRGALRQMTGVVIGFSQNRNCRVKLNAVQPGVELIIDPAALSLRPPTDEHTLASDRLNP